LSAKLRYGFIAGPSGIGKGYAVGSVIQEYRGARVFVTGDWCRENAERNASSGVLVDDLLIFHAIENDFSREYFRHYFIDAPRSVLQVKQIIDMYRSRIPEVEIHTIHIEGSHGCCHSRLADRARRQSRNDDLDHSIIQRRLDAYFRKGGIQDSVVPILREQTNYHIINGDDDLESIRNIVREELCPRIFPGITNPQIH